MSDETWKGIIIPSIPPMPKWLPAIPSLYSMSTSSDIISTLLAHGMILGRGTTAKSSDMVLAARMTEGCTNPSCKAKKQSMHTTSNCYWPGGGNGGQFLLNFGQQTKANSTLSMNSETTSTTTNSNPSTNTTLSVQASHFVLSAQEVTTPGQSGIIIDTTSNGPHIALISQVSKNSGKEKSLLFWTPVQVIQCLC